MRGSFFLLLVSQLLQGGTRSRYSIAFKPRAVAVAEAQSYPFPSIVSGCLVSLE